MDERDILASKRVIRVIGVMAEHGELPISELARKTGIDHQVATKIVKQLTEHGLLSDEYKGQNRVITARFQRYSIHFTKSKGLETRLEIS